MPEKMFIKINRPTTGHDKALKTLGLATEVGSVVDKGVEYPALLINATPVAEFEFSCQGVLDLVAAGEMLTYETKISQVADDGSVRVYQGLHNNGDTGAATKFMADMGKSATVAAKFTELGHPEMAGVNLSCLIAKPVAKLGKSAEKVDKAAGFRC